MASPDIRPIMQDHVELVDCSGLVAPASNRMIIEGPLLARSRHWHYHAAVAFLYAQVVSDCLCRFAAGIAELIILLRFISAESRNVCFRPEAAVWLIILRRRTNVLL